MMKHKPDKTLRYSGWILLAEAIITIGFVIFMVVSLKK